MRYILTTLFSLYTFAISCQDKIYFLDGTNKTGKVIEIAPEYISIKHSDQINLLPRSTILLIEFSNGTIEKINEPKKEVIFNADKKENFHFKQSKKEIYNFNQVSINSLALCNADIAGFYERILPNKKIGLGLMGAYNINQYVNGFNINMVYLSNSKKNYDLGALVNLYPIGLEKTTTIYFGLMVKYTSFNYNSIKLDSVITGNLVSVTSRYTPKQGNQFAALITTGSHTNLTDNFFIKTIVGIGAFKVYGDYKAQYALSINNQNSTFISNTNTQTLNNNFLLKFYFGINIGFKL